MPIVVSLFSGAGGLEQGFRATGYEVGCCVEIDKWACDTLKRNHPETPVMGPPSHSGDIRSISATDIYKFAGLRAGDVDVLIGAPPCQGFGLAKPQNFLEQDKRFKRQDFDDLLKVNLLSEYIRLVLEFQPRAFVLVNVSGLMKADRGILLKQVLAKLHDCGYCTSPPKILNVADYGVPQDRKHLIIWGSRTIDNPTLPEGTHARSASLVQRTYNTVAHAFVGMPQNLANHFPRRHTGSIIELYRKLDLGQREEKRCVERLEPTKPSKIICNSLLFLLHPFIERRITVRESARLQTFDDNYVFEGSISHQFKQVGNAVPPLFSEHLARHLKLQEFAEEATNPIYHGQYLHHEENLKTLIEKLVKESKPSQVESQICSSKDYWYESLERPIQDFISQYLSAIGVENKTEVWDDGSEYRADIVANSISTVIEVKRILDRKTLWQAKSQVKTYAEKLKVKYSLVIGLPPREPNKLQAAKQLAKEQAEWNFKVIFLDPDDSKTLGLDKHFMPDAPDSFDHSIRELIRRIQEAVMAYWEAFSRTTRELLKPASKSLPYERRTT